MADPFLSQINGYGLNFAIRSWAFCHGQTLQIATNTALFSLLGTIYGGDGRNTFLLPDLRGRLSFQHGRGPGLRDYQIGLKGGRPEITQTVNELPAHTHPAGHIGAAAALGTVIAPAADAVVAVQVAPGGNASAYAPVASRDTTISARGGLTGNTGGSQPLQIQNPFLAITYEIAIQGSYPSRS